MVDVVSYDLMLREFNVFIEGIPNDSDLVLFAAIDLKGRFIDLFGEGL